MIGKLILGLAAGAMAAAALAAQGRDVPETIDWTIAPAGRAEQVQFGVSWRSGDGSSNSSRPIAISELEGLSPAQLGAASATDAAFRLVRDAGRLDCEGVVRTRRGTGTCRFAADPAFVAELERRGVGRPDERQLFMLTLQNGGLGLLDELRRLGYAQPRVDDLVAAAIHGVDIAYIRGLDAAGYRLGSVDGLVKMRIHGVTPRYIAELIEVAPRYRGIPADELVAMRIHGVRPDKVRGLAELGYRDLSPEQLLQMSIHGVTPAYIRSLAEAGYANLSAEQLVRMKIHGITADAAARTNAALAGAD